MGLDRGNRRLDARARGASCLSCPQCLSLDSALGTSGLLHPLLVLLLLGSDHAHDLGGGSGTALGTQRGDEWNQGQGKQPARRQVEQRRREQGGGSKRCQEGKIGRAS